MDLQAIFEMVPRNDDDAAGAAQPGESRLVGRENHVKTFGHVTTVMARR